MKSKHTILLIITFLIGALPWKGHADLDLQPPIDGRNIVGIWEGHAAGLEVARLTVSSDSKAALVIVTYAGKKKVYHSTSLYSRNGYVEIDMTSPDKRVNLGATCTRMPFDAGGRMLVKITSVSEYGIGPRHELTMYQVRADGTSYYDTVWALLKLARDGAS